MEILLRLGSLFGLLLSLAGLWPILFGQQTLFEVLKKFLTWLDAARKKVVALNSIHLVLLIVGVVILTTVNIPTFTSFLNPSKPAQPGGVWLSPNSNGLVIKHLAHFAARSYPSNRADPPIDHVEFRVFWAGLHYWITACASYTPAPGTSDTYECDVDLTKIGVPLGTVEISFDVFDQEGNSTKAPNGIYKFQFSP